MTLIAVKPAGSRLAGAGRPLLNASDINNRPTVDQVPPDISDAIPGLWGLTIAQLLGIIAPLNIAAGMAFTLVFAVVAVFAKHWRLGFAVLGVGMLLVAFPWIVAGVRMDATAGEMAFWVIKIWRDTFLIFAYFFLPLALLARWIWDDLGKAFEVILDRYGTRGAVAFIVVVLAVYAARLALRHWL